MENKKSNLSVLLGAAFLMATSAIGPGFMTQTAKFTKDFNADFALVIVVSIIMAYITQLNVWRVIAVSKMRGQDIANQLIPGLGYVIAFLVALGGLAFNIGNIGGAGLGLNVIFGVDPRLGAAIGGVIGIIIFSSKSAGKMMDRLTQILGAVMIILIAYVAIVTQPPIVRAAESVIAPHNQLNKLFEPILTLLGGTVGGYIVFSGGHRLIDAGIVGEENLPQVNRSATLGVGVALIVRVLLFLAVLGVVATGAALDQKNIAASAFQVASGTLGYKIFGIVFSAAAFTSVVGAAYTSVSFLKTLFKPIAQRENIVTILFIVLSTVCFILIGQPQKVLVLVGALNGLILPITLAVILAASKNRKIVGDYKHSTLLFVLGIIVCIAAAYLGGTTIVQNMKKLF